VPRPTTPLRIALIPAPPRAATAAADTVPRPTTPLRIG
jgi:hypothetical protein